MELKLSKDKVKATFEIAESFAGDGKLLGNDGYIEVKDGVGNIITTDGTYSFEGRFDIVKVEGEGKFLIPIKKFIGLLKELPQEDFTIKTEEGKIILKGKKFKYILMSKKVEDFVFLKPDGCDNVITINSIKLATALKKVYFAAYKDSSKRSLNSVYISINADETDIVATDTTRLAYKTLATKDNITIKNGNQTNIIIPISTIQNLLPLLENYDGNIEIKLCDRLIQFVFSNGFVITSRIIDEEYPKYKNIAPLYMNDFEVIVHRKEMANALKRIENMVDDKIVNLIFSKKEMKLQNRAADSGEGEEVIDVINKDGYENTISLNIMLIADILKNSLADELVLRLSQDVSKPVAIKEYQGDDKYIYIMMPIRS